MTEEEKNPELILDDKEEDSDKNNEKEIEQINKQEKDNNNSIKQDEPTQNPLLTDPYATTTYILKYKRSKEELKEYAIETNLPKSENCLFMLNVKILKSNLVESADENTESPNFLVICCHEIAAIYFDEIYERIYTLEDLYNENIMFKVFDKVEEARNIIDESIKNNEKNPKKIFINLKDKELKLHMKLSFFDKEKEIIINIPKKILTDKDKNNLLIIVFKLVAIFFFKIPLIGKIAAIIGPKKLIIKEITKEKEKEEKKKEENEDIKDKHLEDDLENLKKEKEELQNNYDLLVKEKDKIEEEKIKITNDYNTIIEENNKLKDENNILKEENNKLKEELNNNKLFKTDIDNEKDNKEKENEKDLLIKQKEEELEQMKLKLSQYENGTIIPEGVKKQMEEIKQASNTEKEEIKQKLTTEMNKKEKAYLKINEQNSKLINELNLKIKEYEEQIKTLSESLTNINKEKTELENIIIKQETKVNDLGEKVNSIEDLLKNKNEEIKENETYSLKLINIIKEQKTQIQSLKKEQKNSAENSAINESNINTINSLKAQIDAIKKKLEVKEDSILTLQKSHKILQEKYLKICSNNRKKEQEILINQAKKMKMEKVEREKELFLQKNKNLLNINKNEIIEKNYSSVSNFKQPKTPNSAYQNQKTINDEMVPKTKNGDWKKKDNNNNNNNNNIQIGTVLPVIKSSKNKERIERLKLKNEDDGKINEINDMMSKIMDEF